MMNTNAMLLWVGHEKGFIILGSCYTLVLSIPFILHAFEAQNIYLLCFRLTRF